MKNDRVGDWLWEEWDGDGLDSTSELVYFTNDWVDLSHDLVRRALASCLQRDGVADSLSDGFRMAESAAVTHAFAGFLQDEKVLTICNEDGETHLGDVVDYPALVSLIEL